MILDTINNIELYRNLSHDIYAGLLFLKNVDSEISLGTYKINSKAIAIVSEYETKAHFIRGYESHNNVIDIQYPIKGIERVKWSPIKGMNINIPYDEVADRIFYKDPLPQSTYVDIGNGIFAIMFTEDGHSPQHFINKPELIKKVTIKISK